MEAHFLQPCPSHRLTHRSVHLSYMQSTTPPRAHSLLHYANFTTFVFETDWKPNVMHSDFSSWSLRLVPRSSPLPIVYWQHPSSAHQLIQKMRNEKRTRGQRKPSRKSAFGGIDSGNPLPSVDVRSSSETTRRFPNSFYSNHTSYIASDGWEWPPNPILHFAFAWLVQKILLLNSPITYSYQLSLIEAWVYIWVLFITLWRKLRRLNPCHTREIQWAHCSHYQLHRSWERMSICQKLSIPGKHPW